MNMPSVQAVDARIIQNFSVIGDRFDFIICDVWGVLHNGMTAFPEAHQALTSLRQQGKTVILLSNAPRPHPDVMPQLDRLGVPRSAYDAMVSSGDITRDLLKQRPGQSVFLLGPDRDLPLLEGLDAPRAKLDAADYVLCTGLFDDEVESPDNYIPMLLQMLERGLPMLCANPDLIVERGPKHIYCAGAIAERYMEMGGKATLIGKPFGIAYEYAFNAFTRLQGHSANKNRTIAIGDAIRTDVKGASQYGISSLFIGNGIHAAEILDQDRRLDPARLATFLGQQAFQPDFVSDHLRG